MKILLTSDWHETPFADKKFETQKASIGEKVIQFFGGAGSQAVMEKMKQIIADERIFVIIHNGDLQENSSNERGILSSEDLASAGEIIGKFENENSTHVFLNMGNHESGYHQKTLPLATDSEGGASSKSLANFLELVCRRTFYHSFLLGGYRICLVPYLVTEEVGIGFDIEKVRKEILDLFRQDLLRSENERILLFIHDPDSLANKRFRFLIQNHRDRIAMIFCGHYHAQISLWYNKWLVRIFSWWWLLPLRWILRLVLNIVFSKDISRRLQTYFQKRKDVPALMRKFEVKIVPAPGGMLGFGGGFLVLDTETLEIKRY